MARGTGGLAPALPPPHSAPGSFKPPGPLWLQRHNRLAEADYTFAHMHTLTQTPGKKVTTWVRGLVFTGSGKGFIP